MADDEGGFCPECGTHFTNQETLKKHCAAIHKKAVAVAEPSNKRARDEEGPAAFSGASENVELAPLLGVLTDAQKDSLLLRAVQRDPDFYERIEEQAKLLLTSETAESRVGSLDVDGVGSAIRWYMTAGVPENAITLLVACSQKLLSSLDALAESLPSSAAGGGGEASTATSAGADGEADEDGSGNEELLAAVEALPAAGAIGALWVETLSSKAVARLVYEMEASDSEELKLLLESLQAVAATVRPVHPALLVGPNGEKIEAFADAMERLEKTFAGTGGKQAGGGKAAKKAKA